MIMVTFESGLKFLSNSYVTKKIDETVTISVEQDPVKKLQVNLLGSKYFLKKISKRDGHNEKVGFNKNLKN